jgi:hypothetical protein
LSLSLSVPTFVAELVRKYAVAGKRFFLAMFQLSTTTDGFSLKLQAPESAVDEVVVLVASNFHQGVEIVAMGGLAAQKLIEAEAATALVQQRIAPRRRPRTNQRLEGGQVEVRQISDHRLVAAVPLIGKGAIVLVKRRRRHDDGIAVLDVGLDPEALQARVAA